MGTVRKGGSPYDAIVRTYIRWNELEKNKKDGITRIQAVCKQKRDELSDNNTKVIPVYTWIGMEIEGNEYWPEDMNEGDYTSEQFKRRLLNG